MEKNFTWIPFYMEFADKLKPFADQRQELIELIKRVFKSLNMDIPTLEKKGSDIVDIDPFTVIGLFNKGITEHNRKQIASEFKKELDIASDMPTDFNGIPILNNLKSTFYYFIGNREEQDIDHLWECFLSALIYADDPTDNNRENFCQAYNVVIKQKGIRWNLSMGLYWIRPYNYLSLDSKNREYMINKLNIPPIKQVPDAENYLNICRQSAEKISDGHEGFVDFPSFSYYVWKTSQITDNNAKPDTNNNVQLNESQAEVLKYFAPLIQALKELGGSAPRQDAHKKVIEIMNISDDELSISYEKTGASQVINRIDFARNDLAHEGFIGGDNKGTWTLTELGKSIQMTSELAGLIHMKWIKINTAKRKGEPIPEIDLSEFYTFSEEYLIPQSSHNKKSE